MTMLHKEDLTTMTGVLYAMEVREQLSCMSTSCIYIQLQKSCVALYRKEFSLSLAFCQHIFLICIIILRYTLTNEYVSAGPESGDVRLSSDSYYRGEVNVFLSGMWVPVASSHMSWIRENAEVVCRELGYAPNGQYAHAAYIIIAYKLNVVVYSIGS